MSREFLLPFQRRWIRDESRLKLGEKCRQAGWTWTEALKQVRRTSQVGWSRDSWITSRDTEQARLFIEDCKFWCGLYKIASDDMGEQIVDDGTGNPHTVFSVRFANGRRINSMSSNVDAQAGKRGDRTADEFALHRDQRRLYGIMKPGIQWGGTISIFSTHRGTGSFFNALIREIKEGNPKHFSHHKVTIEDAVREGLWDAIRRRLPDSDEQKRLTADEWLQAQRDECPDEETWLEEYMCVPSDDDSAVLPWHLIDLCRRSAADLRVSDSHLAGRLYLGVDIGRKKHFTVFWLLEDVGNLLITRKVEILQNTPFHQQEARLEEYLKNPRLSRCAIDATGLGMQLAENAVLRHGAAKVAAVTFNNRVKQELAFPLRARFEDGSILIPDERDILADLRSVKRVRSASDNLILRADDGPNGHADRFWALALASHAQATLTDPGFFARILSMLPGSRSRSRRIRSAM